MTKQPPLKINSSALNTFLLTEGPALLVLLASLVVFFFDWLRFPSENFLSLDTTDIYYPFYYWVHEHLRAGKIPLISDLSYHGAPMPAVVIVGFLSPVLWLFHVFSSYNLVFNLLFISPWVLFLFGAYFLGRALPLSRTASLLLAFLWTYNGGRLAHLDHLNITWACAFFPWAFWSLSRFRDKRKLFWLLLSGLGLGLNLLSGHPQILFYEGLFLGFWALFSFSPASARPKWKDALAVVLIALWVASPLVLNMAECLTFDGFRFQWNEINRFFHSWTPLNFITLVFPWFFGKTQFDRAGTDYWWQYQFVEMQVSFSIAGLFFILLFLFRKGPQRLWITLTALFGLLMAMGRFSFLYPLVQSLPGFSWFRDPARYWFLISWVLGLGAAYAWEDWFKGFIPRLTAKKIAPGLGLFSVGFIAVGWALLTLGRPLLEQGASFFIRHFLLGDSLHTLALSDYMNRLPEKLNLLAFNLDPRQPRVIMPLLLLTVVNLVVFLGKRLKTNSQKALWLILVFADLMAFRAPLGQSFYPMEKLSRPSIPACGNRMMCFLYGTPSPLPRQYEEMGYANMNYLFHIPTLSMEANPQMERYAKISELLGWFSWVYKDRNPLGFSKHPNLMRVLGLDLLVTDKELDLSAPFQTVKKDYPYAYRLSPVLPKAYLVDQVRIGKWPGSIDLIEKSDFHPFQEAVLDSAPDLPFQLPPSESPLPSPQIRDWDETHLSLSVKTNRPCLLVLQKTFLPGWKARVNAQAATPLRCNLVLTALPLSPGENQVELTYDPSGLRLGFFLFFLFFGVFSFSLFRRLVA